MSLASGSKLGPYVIAGSLGAGGMGEVYRARDAKLNREVAIKVVPAALASDPAALGRFHAEAQAVAALSHPNILAIFDFGVEGETPYAVMELLKGQSLREALEGGALPPRKAVEYARQIAAGLAAAHARGITHRDLKPENVFITADGLVKILDFGLAKVQDVQPGGAGQSFTPTRNVTTPGTVLGTVGYMAPEQVRGEAADARTDLFALGAVLYEMLSGRRAFQRDTAAETMTAILREDPPDIGATPVPLSPALDRIVRHCLEKNPAERFQSGHDVAFALEALSGSGTTGAATAVVRKRTWPPVLRWGALAAGGLLLVWLGFATGTYKASAPMGLPVSWEGELMGGPLAGFLPRVSPSGQELAFVTLVGKQAQLAKMMPASGDWMPLTSEPMRGNPQQSAWSRDGARIYFDRYESGQPNIFWISALGGGREQPVLPDASSPTPLPDGSLLVERLNSRSDRQLHRFWPEGERLEPLPAINSGGTGAVMPFRVLPGGKAAVFFGRPEGEPSAKDGLRVIDLDTRRMRVVAPGVEIRPRDWLFPLAVSPDGAWVLFDMPTGDVHRIAAARSDGSAGLHVLLTLTGEPLGLDVGPNWDLFIDQIAQATEIRWYQKPGAPPTILRLPDSAHYSPALPIDRGRVLVALRSAGRARVMVVEPGKLPAPLVDTPEETKYPFARLGPDRILMVIGTGNASRVAIASLATGRVVRKIDSIDAGKVLSLAGSHDGSVVYYSADNVIWSMPASGGKPQRVCPGHGVAVDPGGLYLIVKFRETRGIRLFRVPLPVGSGPEQPVGIEPGSLRITDDFHMASAMARDGRLLVRVASKADWYWPAAILDPKTGHLEPIDPAFDRDMYGPAWSDDGQVVTQATTLQSTLWRFRPRWK
jgi:eukaryotic-like serine/threonine-protein kinase